jgi:hypothetical protein
MPPPGSQGAQSSCAAWATAYALKTSHEKVERKWEILQNNQLVPHRVFSPAFVYNQVNHGKDEGSYFSEVFKLLQEKGCATLSSTPYSDKDYLTSPSAQAMKEAGSFKIAWAKDIDPTETGTIRSYISHGYPIIIGADVDDAFTQLKAGQIVSTMGSGGGHAMVVVGYDDKKAGGCFKIMNSWGTQWGDKGFCWMTYALFKKVVHEAWLVEDAEEGKVIDAPLDDNNKPYTEDKDDTEETIEFEDELEAYIELDSVEEVDSYEGLETYGIGMVISGFIDIDVEAGSEAQVVMYFSNPEDEEEHFSCTDENFSDINDQLISYTDPFKLEEWINTYDGDYEVFIPYKLLNKTGMNKVLAIPILFIDGVDVAHGEPFEIEYEE